MVSFLGMRSRDRARARVVLILPRNKGWGLTLQRVVRFDDMMFTLLYTRDPQRVGGRYCTVPE